MQWAAQDEPGFFHATVGPTKDPRCQAMIRAHAILLSSRRGPLNSPVRLGGQAASAKTRSSSPPAVSPTTWISPLTPPKTCAMTYGTS
jgi:hypothetical protein